MVTTGKATLNKDKFQPKAFTNTSLNVALGFIYFVLFCINFYEMGQLTSEEMSSAAAGFYSWHLLYTAGFLFFIIFIASITIAVISRCRPQSFIALYAIAFELFLLLPLPLSYFDSQWSGLILFFILLVPPLIASIILYRQLNSSKESMKKRKKIHKSR